MRVSQKGKVIQLSFMPRFFPVNCYFVEEEREITLIDAALPYCAKPIVHLAERMGKPITRIILTHAHEDHVGALDRIKRIHPHIQVYISERDSALLKGERRLLPEEPNTPIRGGIPKKISTTPDFFLREGERIGSLEVIFSPGHTPGSVSLFDTRDRHLIAGDAFQTRGGMAVAGMLKAWFPFPALATWSKDIALQSAKKLADFEPRLLAVGHGRMLEEPKDAMLKAIMEAERKYTRSAMKGE